MTRDGDLRAEAADWLASLDAGTARPEEFALWRDADPRRAVAFAEAVAAWETLGRDQARESVPVPASPARAPSRRALLRAAAVAGPVLTLAGMAAVLRDGRAHAATAVGEMRRFEAAPGLTIELNTDSRLSWEVRGRDGEVWLEKGEAALFIDGEALNGVTLNLAREKVLLAPGAYSTRSLGEEPEVLVLDGGARVSGAAAAPLAQRGQRLSLARGARPTPQPEPDLGAATAWRRGEIVFTGETLSEAVAEYNRYLDRKLVLADEDIGAIRIGGRFETVRPEPFLRALESGFDLTASVQGDRILIERMSTAG
ncbi:FecR family protein [Brevundimonas sp.]|uniref:FecR family protein n=1 Tax=Brevundimonas sp. TaxID=1871086 RepID=UPI00391C5CC6